MCVACVQVLRSLRRRASNNSSAAQTDGSRFNCMHAKPQARSSANYVTARTCIVTVAIWTPRVACARIACSGAPMRPSTRLSRCRLLLPALLPLLCSAAQLPPGARSRSGALDSSRDKADEQQKLLQRVVDARLSAAEHLLPSEDDNTTHPMLKAPLAAFSKTTAWLRRENPTLFAFLLGALATTSKEQNDLADGSRTQVNKGGHCRLARRSRPLNAPLGPLC